MSYKGSIGFYEQNMWSPDKYKKKVSSSSSKRVKKSVREPRGSTVDSFKAYHPYNVQAQPAAASRPSPCSSRAVPAASSSFSPQMSTVGLPSGSPPPPRPRPVSRLPSPIPKQQQSPASSLRHLLHAIEDYQGAVAYPHERHCSPESLSRSSSFGTESSYSGRSRSSSPATTPPLTPHSASSRLSVASSSRSSSRHCSPDPMDYYATCADTKPTAYEYDQFLGSYHANVDHGLYRRRN